MSALSAYLQMDNTELAEEIVKQKRKIASAQETIALLKKLQIAGDTIAHTRQSQHQQNAGTENSGMDSRQVTGTP